MSNSKVPCVSGAAKSLYAIRCARHRQLTLEDHGEFGVLTAISTYVLAVELEIADLRKAIEALQSSSGMK